MDDCQRNMRYSRPKAVIFVGSVLAAMVIGISVITTRLGPEVRVNDDLLSISQGRAPSAIIDKFDAVCFDAGAGRFDLINAARSNGMNIDASLKACGIDQTCCGANSDLAGYIGLVRGNAVMCVEVNRFEYHLEGDEPFCAKPSQLRVSQHTHTTRFNPPRRAYFTIVGRKYFQVGRKQ